MQCNLQWKSTKHKTGVNEVQAHFMYFIFSRRNLYVIIRHTGEAIICAMFSFCCRCCCCAFVLVICIAAFATYKIHARTHDMQSANRTCHVLFKFELQKNCNEFSGNDGCEVRSHLVILISSRSGSLSSTQ